MKLKEVCEKTGLSRKTIRLYEEKGLLVPQKELRNGREYREYTQEDVEKLRVIALLRRAWFTMDEIKQMQDDPDSIQDIFPQYCKWLEKQKQDLDELIAVARNIEITRVEDITQLTEEMSSAAQKLPLPNWDISPKFRYLDEIEEEVRNMNQNAEKTLQQSRQKTYRQTLLMLDQDKINNHAITFGQIKEVEETNWKEDQPIREEEHLPKAMIWLSNISLAISIVGLVIFLLIYISRFGTVGGEDARSLPLHGVVSLLMFACGGIVFSAIRGYAAWKERQAWIQRMRQQDMEKAQRRKES